MTPFERQDSSNQLDIPLLYGENLFFYSYARYALFEFLSKSNIKSIYLPSLICRDLLSAINSAGVQYSFYHIDQNFYPIDLSKQCDAILFVNYFGFSFNLNPYKEYAKKNKAILIEDNAHGFLSQDEDGKLLGTRGDIGIFSLRKTIALPNGAMLKINNSSIHTGHFKDATSKATFEDRKFYIKQNLKTISPRLAYYSMKIGQAIRFLKNGTTIPLENENAEKQLPPNPYLTPLLANHRLSINIQNEILRRKQTFEYLKTITESFNISPLHLPHQNNVPFSYPFLSTKEIFHFQKELDKRYFYVLPWPSLPEEIKLKVPSWYKQIKVVPFLW